MRRFFGSLPRVLKTWGFGPCLGAIARLLLIGRAPQPGPAQVAGLLRSPTGIGEGARLHLAALASKGGTAYGLDLTPWFPNCRTRIAAPAYSPALPGGGCMVIHLNPNHLALGLFLIGRRHLKNKRIIGYWAWELPRIPKYWRFAFKLVDEVWTPSSFVAAAVRHDAPPDMPVTVQPHPVQAPPVGRETRADFGIPAQSFLCVVAADAGSALVRKYPEAAIDSFLSAFGAHEDAWLFIKIRELDPDSPTGRKIGHVLRTRPKVVLDTATWRAETFHALLKEADCLLSLHRAEGFGLILAEAMALGTPVVATGWSGNLDFMTPPLARAVRYDLVPVKDPAHVFPGGDGMYWAEPDITHAAALLRQVTRETRPACLAGEKERIVT